MALYFLSYDLRKERDYQTLYDELAKFKAVRLLESDWCFQYQKEGASVELRDHFKSFIDDNDGLIVSEVIYWASYKTEKTPKDLK